MSLHSEDYKAAAGKVVDYGKTHVWVWVIVAAVAAFVVGAIAFHA